MTWVDDFIKDVLDHECDSEWGECHSGELYGFCGAELCGGACEYHGVCPCECHDG